MQVRSHQPRLSPTRSGSTDATIIAVVAFLLLAAAGGFFYKRSIQIAANEAQFEAAEKAALDDIEALKL